MGFDTSNRLVGSAVQLRHASDLKVCIYTSTISILITMYVVPPIETDDGQYSPMLRSRTYIHSTTRYIQSYDIYLVFILLHLNFHKRKTDKAETSPMNPKEIPAIAATSSYRPAKYVDISVWTVYDNKLCFLTHRVSLCGKYCDLNSKHSCW